MGFIINPFFGNSISPDDFPGLVRWYKADSYSLADGDRIGGTGREWIDQSASVADATQPVIGNRPLFSTNIFGSLPAVVFTPGDNSWLEMTGLVLAGTFTTIVVGKANASTSVLGSLTQNIWTRLHVSSLNLDFYGGAGGVQSDVFTAFNTPLMFSWRRDGAALFSFREGNTSRGSYTDSGGLLSVTYTEIGGTAGGGGGDASIGEICVYNTLLSDADMNSLYTAYFKPKWGLP